MPSPTPVYTQPNTREQILNNTVKDGFFPTAMRTASSDMHAHTYTCSQALPGPHALITKTLTGTLWENSKISAVSPLTLHSNYLHISERGQHIWLAEKTVTMHISGIVAKI